MFPGMNPTGCRLAFVVVKLQGDVQRETCRFVGKGKGIVREATTQDAGYMVYFPRGHCMRLRNKDELKHYGLDGEPTIINLQGLNDPTSPIGRMMNSQDDAIRRKGYHEMEKMVIGLATAKTGPVVMPEQLKEAA